jgi:hypothetical protein
VRKAREKQAKPKRKAPQDQWHGNDTPKAFARLMQFQKRGKGINGLDNGDEPRGKKRKRGNGSNVTPAVADATEPIPKILPGERLGDFAARVDQSLPVAGLTGKGKKMEGFKERQTTHTRKLLKIQATWREEEARIREKEAEARELAEEDEDETAALLTSQKKSKRKPGAAEDEEDPWEILKKTREQPKGLHDVVQAPPQFKKIPKEKFKIRNGARADVADIPNAAGSLRRREELGETRKSVIESYRQMMDGKRKTF